PDRARARAEEHAHPLVLSVALAVGSDQGLEAGDVHGDLAEAPGVLGPQHLADRGLGPRLEAGRCERVHPLGLVPDDLDLRVGPGELLADDGVVDPAVLPGLLDDPLPVVEEADVAVAAAAPF